MHIVLFLIFQSAAVVFAQIDLSSSSLLVENSGDLRTAPLLPGPGSSLPEKQKKLSAKLPPKKSPMKEIKIEEPAATVTLLSPPTNEAAATPKTKPEVEQESSVMPKPEVPPVYDQVKSFVQGQENPQVEAYIEQVHPEDQRLNRVEMELSSGIYHQGANSNTVYRSYSMTAPLMGYRLGFWVTPFLGFDGSLRQALSGDVSNSIDGNKRVAIQNEQTTLRLVGRRFYGLSRKSNYLTWGLSYWTENLKVPSDETSRVSLKSTAWGLTAQVDLPSAPSYTWNLGGSLYPRVMNSENSTGLSLVSGTGPESGRVEFHIGGNFRMSRSNAMTWRLGLAVEKNQYSGSSNQLEPSGQAASSVSVIKSTTGLELGYLFGL